MSCLTLVCDVGVLWRNGWMDQDEIWYGDRHQSRPHYVRWGPSSPHQKEAQLHNFRLMSIVAKRSPISATADLLYRPKCNLVDIPVAPKTKVLAMAIAFDAWALRARG